MDVTSLVWLGVARRGRPVLGGDLANRSRPPAVNRHRRRESVVAGLRDNDRVALLADLVADGVVARVVEVAIGGDDLL